MSALRTWTAIGMLVAAASLFACGGGGPAPVTVQQAAGPNPHALGSKFQIPAGMAGVKAIDVEVIVAGTGPQAGSGRTARVHYSGTAVGKTKPYNDTRAKGAPLEEVTGVGAFQPGLDSVLVQMHVGDRWKATIPPELMFGKNAGPNLPANATIVVDVELLAILD